MDMCACPAVCDVPFAVPERVGTSERLIQKYRELTQNRLVPVGYVVQATSSVYVLASMGTCVLLASAVQPLLAHRFI